jgi:hypothetical protein
MEADSVGRALGVPEALSSSGGRRRSEGPDCKRDRKYRVFS